MAKIKTIILKEWEEVFKNRLVLFTVLFLPLVFLVLPFGTLAVIPQDGSAGDLSGMMNDAPQFLTQMCNGMNESDCGTFYLLSIYLLLFMILPVAIPVTIAAYSIVGEKTTRSLEPLLATPITTFELLMGKMIAAAVPAIVATWGSFLIFAFGVRFMVNEAVWLALWDPVWLMAVFIVGPQLTVMSVSVAIMISSRTSDPRVAEQLSAVVVLPVIMFVVGQSLGLFLINSQFIIGAVLILFVVDAGLVYLTMRLFQRETILTQWK